MEILGNMAQTFRMCTVRVWIEKYIVEIDRAAFGNFPNPIAHSYRFYIGFVLVPGQRVLL